MKAKGLDVIEPYKPKGWAEVPAGLKDPDGAWTTIHSGTLGLFVNKDALGGKPVPACWKDLFKPEYKGMVGYLDPSSAAVGYVGVIAVNNSLGGSENNFTPAIEFFKGLKKNDADRAEADVLCARGVGRNPDLVRLRLQRLPRQIHREGQFRLRHPLRRFGRFPLCGEPGEERAGQSQGREGARLHAVGQGSGDLDERLFAAGTANPLAGGRQVEVPAQTATMPAPRASIGRRWNRCKRDSPTATSPKCIEALWRSGIPPERHLL